MEHWCVSLITVTSIRSSRCNYFKRWLLGNNKKRKILETSWIHWF